MEKSIHITDTTKENLHKAVEYFYGIHKMLPITGYYIVDASYEEKFNVTPFDDFKNTRIPPKTETTIKTLYFVSGTITSDDMAKGLIPFPAPLTVDSLTEIAWNYYIENAVDKDYGDGCTVKAFSFIGTEYFLTMTSGVSAACKITATNIYYGK